MRYRKIVREVEAYQLTAAMIDAHLLDEAPLPKGLRLARAGYHRGNRVVYNATFSVTTIHGEDARVVVNDWIITEMDGEHFYPCKPEIFAVDYEAVGAPHPRLGSGALREALEQRIKECREMAERWETESRNVRIDRAIHKDYSLALNALANLLERALSLSSPIEPPPIKRKLKPGPYKKWCAEHGQAPPCTACDYEDVGEAQASSEIRAKMMASFDKVIPSFEMRVQIVNCILRALAPSRQGAAKRVEG